MNTLVYSLASWLLAPIALVQGLQVRARTQRLAPPTGRPYGHYGSEDTSGYRILVVGDSSAAGVGADDVSETVGAQLAKILHQQTGHPASWRNAGSNSAISAQVRDHVVPNLQALDYTHIIIAVGTNDMKNFVTVSSFKKGFGGLLYALKAKWPDATLIWSPAVDTRTVPSLPTALANILRLRLLLINGMGERLCRERYAIAATQLQPPDASGFASDGFHAGPKGYRFWAELLAETILTQAPLEPEPE